MPPIRRRRPDKLVRPLPTSHTHVSDKDPNTGTEFSGVAGVIQPDPHVMNAHERRTEIFCIDPTDPGGGSEPGAIDPPEFEWG